MEKLNILPMPLKRAIVLLIFFGLTGFTVFTSNGTFIKWNVSNGDSVKFILNTEGCDCDLTDEELSEAFENSLARWNAVKGSHFQFLNLADVSPELFVADPTLADSKPEYDDDINVIGFSDDVPAGFAGYTQFRVEGDHIIEADIFLGSGLGYNQKYLESLLIHELGHVLGLGHDHADVASIMSYGREAGRVRLGVDDIIGIVTIYPKSGREAKPDLGCTTIFPSDHDRTFFDSSLGAFLFFVLLTILSLKWQIMNNKRKLRRQSAAAPRFFGFKGALTVTALFLGVAACGDFTDGNKNLASINENLSGNQNSLDWESWKGGGPRDEADGILGPQIEGGQYFGIGKPTLLGDKVTFFCPEGV